MISSTAEYALRALVALAGESEGTTLQAARLAEATEVPPSYLYKVLRTLRRAGILSGTRGNRGGYRLARDPQETLLIDVISLFDTVRPAEVCLLRREHTCNDSNPCSAHGRWETVQSAYHDFLTATTIADLSERDGV